MQLKTYYPDSLPLQGESGFSRRILVDSCLLDADHVQIRSELVDARADYQDECQEVPVHGMVIRLEMCLSDGIITDAQFALPRMAFPGACEHLPVGPEPLIGLHSGPGFSKKVRDIYGASATCMHLSALLKATIQTFTQCRSWNHSFRELDENTPAEQAAEMMAMFRATVADSCHAWAEPDGAIIKDFDRGEYTAMLNRVSPRLLARWQLYQQEQGSNKVDD